MNTGNRITSGALSPDANVGSLTQHRKSYLAQRRPADTSSRRTQRSGIAHDQDSDPTRLQHAVELADGALIEWAHGRRVAQLLAERRIAHDAIDAGIGQRQLPG